MLYSMIYKMDWRDHLPSAETRSKNFVDQITLLKICYSMIYSHLTCSISSWGNASLTNLEPLFKLEKGDINVIKGKTYRAHSTPLFHKLNILALDDIFFQETTIFMHKYHSNKLPNSQSLFYFSAKSQHCCETRYS